MVWVPQEENIFNINVQKQLNICKYSQTALIPGLATKFSGLLLK